MNYKLGLYRLFNSIFIFLGCIISFHFSKIVSNYYRSSILYDEEAFLNVTLVFLFWFALTFFVGYLFRKLIIWIIDGFIEKE